jgi:hypothetical protein
VAGGDATGAISVAVPSGWAGQARQSGWDPAAVGLASTKRPGVAVAPDLASWNREYAGGPGVFAGTADGLDRATLPVHERCDRSERAIPGGRVVRWTRCAGTTISYSEVLTGGVYLQVKQVGDADLTDEIVRTVHS